MVNKIALSFLAAYNGLILNDNLCETEVLFRGCVPGPI
jgi:hypothetical protein